MLSFEATIMGHLIRVYTFLLKLISPITLDKYGILTLKLKLDQVLVVSHHGLLLFLTYCLQVYHRAIALV